MLDTVSAVRSQKVEVYDVRGRECVVATDLVTGHKYITTPESKKAFKTVTSHGRFTDPISDILADTFITEDIVWDSTEDQATKAASVLAAAVDTLFIFNSYN